MQAVSGTHENFHSIFKESFVTHSVTYFNEEAQTEIIFQKNLEFLPRSVDYFLSPKRIKKHAELALRVLVRRQTARAGTPGGVR
jgi:hypothetical protein